ncbi:hypothetical protein GW916_01895 [bacterium]|nr:hypothetical protein [bacterium]
MPKKTTKKKTVKKITRQKPFDLSVDRDDQAQEVISALKSLQADRGWLLLKQMFEGNISVLQASILRKVSPDDGVTALTEEECDRLRDKLDYLEELLDKPNKIIQSFKQPISTVPEYDPYDKVPIPKGKG